MIIEDFREIVEVIRASHPGKYPDQTKMANDFKMSRQSFNNYLVAGRIPYPQLHKFLEDKGYSLDALYYDNGIQPVDFKQTLPLPESEKKKFDNTHEVYFELKDDSMTPTFPVGTVLIADTRKDFRKSGLFLIKKQHRMHFVRIVEMISNPNEYDEAGNPTAPSYNRQFQIRKDNPQYPIEYLSKNELDEVMVGRVIKSIQPVS